jgi:L-asparagine oxygenase
VTERTLRAILNRRGWAVTEARNAAELLSLAETFGEVAPSRAGGPVIDELRPKPVSEAPPRSLSARHGLDAFPYHTDAAHHVVPPRFVILRFASKRPSTRRTLVASLPGRLRQGDRDVLEHDVWLVDGGRGRFLTSVLSRPDGFFEEMVRFDECCMRPAEATFGAARAVILGVLASRSVAIDWVPSRALILDNWRTLHAREGRPHHDGDRVLERVLVAAE